MFWWYEAQVVILSGADPKLDAEGINEGRRSRRISLHLYGKTLMALKTYFVYMMTNLDRSVLYFGMTNDLERRVAEHKTHSLRGFTDAYNVTVLVYFEPFDDPVAAISREKQLKGWTRAKKNALVERVNSSWKELDLTTDAEV